MGDSHKAEGVHATATRHRKSLTHQALRGEDATSAGGDHFDARSPTVRWANTLPIVTFDAFPRRLCRVGGNTRGGSAQGGEMAPVSKKRSPRYELRRNQCVSLGAAPKE